MAARISDVAERAGVSVATVSRVSSGQRVNQDMAGRVRAAMTELNYSPSRTARSLRRQTSEIIALIIPDIENPYFTELARGVEDVARENGYSVVLCNTDSDRAREDTYLGIAAAENMAGVIIAPAGKHTGLDVLDGGSIPAVSVDRSADRAIDTVLMDDREAARAATESLIQAGYTRIACITGPRGVETSIQRTAGWRAAMSAHDLSVPESFLIRSTYGLRGGREAMTALLDEADPPDAVITMNNLMGVGALQILTERRLFPPQVGVAVVGNLPFTTFSPTGITLANQPAREMGITAARMLMDRIAGDKQPPRKVILSCRLEPATLDDAAR